MKLFSGFSLGTLSLPNRIVMAPMTRCRATGNVPNAIMAEYYGQRASAGLIVTEGTSPSPNGLGYARIPGIFSDAQQSGWKRVADAVHAAGGRIFMQLMHCGRVGSLLNMPENATVLAPSDIPLNGTIWTDSHGERPYDLPRAMTLEDIHGAISEYVRGAVRAIEAGFDGIEVHGANGYLVTQFLDPGSNQRSDEYGGDASGRNRFALKVVRAVSDAVGRLRTGIRLSPYGVFNGMSGNYDGIAAQYEDLAAGLGRIGIAYIHMVDHSSMGAPKPDREVILSICRAFRRNGGSAVILSGGYDAERAEEDLLSGAADLVAFGRPFIANPDLVDRLASGSPCAVPDQSTFYTPGPAGYIDYPALKPV